jgi:protein-S-isoprenylcysteine O-methyltransferase Ste14
MSYAPDIINIIILFTVFACIHTILASLKIKEIIRKKFGSFIAVYRLFYNIFALMTFYLFLRTAPHPDLNVYDLSYPFDFVILIPQFLALAGIIWSAKFSGVGEFSGISQVVRWSKHEYDTGILDEKMTLTTKGPYKFVRHPVYFFSIIFLMCRPVMDLFYLTLLVCIIGYFYIGSIFEERKLIRVFGSEYIKYKERVPRIFPVNITNIFNQ